ncbi:O-methyltransferase bik3 [Penicillium rolfsii]|nr:O-methyltransferase bik3 [Penicillium rolfsii]
MLSEGPKSLPAGKDDLLSELASSISSNAQIVSKFLQSEGHSAPSFEGDAASTVVPATAPTNVQVAREALLEASMKMFQLASGPREYLPNLAVHFPDSTKPSSQYQYLSCLHWLIHFGIFSRVPSTGSITYASLAADAGVPERTLKTVARMIMTSQVFYEPQPGSIAHTATSAQFVTNQSLNDWAQFMCEASVPAALSLVAATERWPTSQSRTETAYNVAADTDLPFFDHLATLPERTRQFAGYMKNVTSSEGTKLDHLLSGFNWAELGSAKIVDPKVGGSTGNAGIALASAFPKLQITVQDLPENAAEGAATLKPDLASRVTFQGHDFFQPQPVIGADIYLLRMILHDWAIPEAVRILQQLVPAMRRGSRIVIMDSVLPRPGSIASTKERLLRVRDLTMLQVFNSCERDLDDWTQLLSLADKRLRLTDVAQPRGSVMSLLTVTLNE